MVRLTDVARVAGVGYGTASRAISGRGSIDAATRDRVLSAAEELGYRPDAAARALRERRTRTIGLVVPDIVNEFYTASAEVLAERLSQSGYQLVVATTGNDAGREKEALRAMLDRQVDGIVHVPVVAGASDGISVPIVELNRTTGRPSVTSDDRAGIAALTALLADAGHTDIVAIAGPSALSTSRERIEGFTDTLQSRGYLADGSTGLRYRVIEGAYSATAGAEAMRQLASDIPDAVVALSSRIAVGVLKEATSLGLSVPDGLALAAYGDPDWFSAWRPGITSFAPDLARLGHLAAAAVLEQLDSAADAESVQVQGELRVRGTHLGNPRR